MFDGIKVVEITGSTFASLEMVDGDYTLSYDINFQDDPEARDFPEENVWARAVCYNHRHNLYFPEDGETEHSY
uniref:Uncharacterized protein n=1 Tax=Pseudomonas phage HRDY3 TaxID=3236930 RepID=A0AB39CEM1_9VIRU